MFWGLVLKANKRYSQRVTKAFHVSQATLDKSTIVDEKADVQLWVTIDEADFLIGNVSGRNSYLGMDVTFTEGESVAFYSKGTGTVHLTGYLIPEDDIFPPGDEDEEDESEEEELELKNLERLSSKKQEKLSNKKAIKATEESDDDEDDDDEDDSDEMDVERELEIDEEAEDEEDSDEEDDDDDDDDDEEDEDDDEDDEEEEDVKAPPSKMAKFDKSANQNGLTNGKLSKKDHEKQKQQQQQQQQQQQKNKKQDQKPEQKQKNQQQNQQQKGSNTKQLSNGVIIEDLRPGKGPEAKPGKKVNVYYEGRLKSNNKVFDSTKSGDGFKFQLGTGEVIRAWDIGIAGMRVGSKRRITCPPAVAYGHKGSPPVIPGNATLVFDVELRGVN